MGNGTKNAVVMALLALTSVVVSGQSAIQTGARGTFTCCGVPPLDQPVKLPKAIVRAWLESKMVAGLRDMVREDPHLDVNKFYSGYEVRLSESDAANVIEGAGPPVSGGDNDWFWIVGNVDNRARVLLYANGNVIESLNSRTNGFKDLQSVWWSAAGYSITCVYRYDGHRYRQFRKYEKTEK